MDASDLSRQDIAAQPACGSTHGDPALAPSIDRQRINQEDSNDYEGAVMRIDLLRADGLCVFWRSSPAACFAHGLVQDPPARNWFCGAVTKPDHVANGVAQYPVCGNAFTAPGVRVDAGYSFMSVLTHTTGRAGVGPRTNVCGFNSETWNGAATVWDQPIDWPTVPMTAGPRNFVWNISWGPHFSDSSDFRYWITKPGFVWQTGRALSFADFEDAPFCDLAYNDATPNANPNLIPDKANALFTTRCTVPARTRPPRDLRRVGPHTADLRALPRLHRRAVLRAIRSPTVTANIALNPNVTTFTGPGSITLNGTGSTGTNLAYSWTVTAPNPSFYTITNPMSATATLNLVAPGRRAGRDREPARHERQRVGYRDSHVPASASGQHAVAGSGRAHDGSAHARGR